MSSQTAISHSAERVACGGSFAGTLLVFLLLALVPAARGAEPEAVLDRTYSARDTLAVGEEPSADARECLQGFCWTPSEFTVRCEAPVQADRGDVLVRFPSPLPTGNEVNDLVALEWYMARDQAGQRIQAPAVVVIHESGKSMPVGRLFARGFQQRGLHAFMIQLPTYGQRRIPEPKGDLQQLFNLIRQATADVRRARDAVAVLPDVDAGNIALQGTSLGGFVASTAGALDQGFSRVFLTLSGGDIFGIIQHGERESAQVRQKFQDAGVSDEELRQLAWKIEPNRLAHRLDPQRTWLYSGTYDRVIPLENAQSLARAAHLERSHHLRMPATHVTGIIFLPVILDQMAGEVLGTGQPAEEER